MCTLLMLMPSWAQLIIILATLIVIAIMSNYGNTFIQWGWLKIGLGHKKKRSCTDCLSILLAKSTKYFSNVLLKNVLEDQMTYSSHKLDNMYLDFIKEYRSLLSESRKNVLNLERENIEYILFKEAVSNAIDLVKKEIRRSFKENGFCDMSGKEFSVYIRDETNVISDMFTRYLMDAYPNHGMIVSLQDVLSTLDINKLEGNVLDIYTNAKQLKINCIASIKKEKEEFENDIDTFIGDK